MCGCPSSTVTSGAARRGRERGVEHPALGRRRGPRAGLDGVEQQAGAGHAHDVGGDARARRAAPPRRAPRGPPRPSPRCVTAGVARAPPQRVGAGDHLAAPPLPRGRVGRAPRRASGPPAGSTAAGRPTTPSGRPSRASDAAASTRRRSRTPARSSTQPGCSSPTDGVLIDWWAPPSGGEGHPGRRADEDRLAAGVDPERPRLQRPLDERVVEHPDRQQRLAPPAPGGAELTEQPDQVGLGDARARGAGRWAARASAGSSRGRRRTSRAARPRDQTPTLFTQPPRLVDELTSGQSVTTRRAASGASRVRSSRARPERGLGGGGARRACGRCRRAARAPARRHRARGAAAPRSPRTARRPAEPVGEPRPRVVGVGADARGELAELLGGEQRRVVLRVALGGQPVALDRVGEDHGRPGVVDGAQRVAAARRGRGRRGCGWRRAGWRRRGRRRARPASALVAGQPLAQLGGRAAQQPLVLGVGHLVDPAPQRGAAGPGEQLLQQPPVLHGEHLPARGVEHALQPGGADVGHDPVEGLPVQVDDPDDLAELGRPSGRGSPPSTRPRPARRRRPASTADRVPSRRRRSSTST